MVVFTSRNKITYEKSEFQAGTRLVMADGMANELRNRMGGENCRVSPINYYLKPYSGQNLNGKSLLVWRSAQGFGDLVMTAGILLYLKEIYQDARIDFAVQPQRDVVLQHQSVFKCMNDVIYFDDFNRYDYHLVFEQMNESCLEPDQPNVYDAHARFAGISMPDERKRPFIPIDECDIDGAAELMEHDKGFTIAYQMQASTPIRSYPPGNTFKLLELLADRFQNSMIYCLTTGDTMEKYVIPKRENIKTFITPNIRFLYGLVELSDVVVCPDSFLGHIAEGLERNCVSLWSSFHPQDRIKYYKWHHPIYQPIECGPCRQHERGRMVLGCPLTLRGAACRGLAMIEPDSVLAEVEKCLTVVD